jgi:hypothetical protein
VGTEGGGNTHYFYFTSKSHVGGGDAKLLVTNEQISEQELITKRGFKDGEHHTINRQELGAGS